MAKETKKTNSNGSGLVLGKGGGEFYAPQYVVRVFDPCCGSGGIDANRDVIPIFIAAC
jgi:hypothetical protein